MGLKYLLDTNILFEPVKPHPNEHVLHKLNQYSGQYCTSVTVWHELHYGVERMTDSKRKKSLFAYLDMLEQGGLIVFPYEKWPGNGWQKSAADYQSGASPSLTRMAKLRQLRTPTNSSWSRAIQLILQFTKN
jgi:hypothetical protein